MGNLLGSERERDICGGDLIACRVLHFVDKNYVNRKVQQISNGKGRGSKNSLFRLSLREGEKEDLLDFIS